jgi:hypothetical protein
MIEEAAFVANTLPTNLTVGIAVPELYGMAVANPETVKTSRAVTTAAMARPLFLESILLSPENDFDLRDRAKTNLANIGRQVTPWPSSHASAKSCF